MAGNAEIKTETLPDLDDLLQCPVCYEIPTGQIFQCNEGHHVCGRCKVRLDMCPVCRALFFGTRNYAMEELIANVRKLRAFKLGGKVTTDTDNSESVPAAVSSASETENDNAEQENNTEVAAPQTTHAPPQACKGLFRCLCCKKGATGGGERLPSARLLNHLRYYHAGDLLEGKSENGEYLQLWQFSTDPGRIVTAVRVTDMGIFFLIIEITRNSLCAWLSMAASPWIAHVFSYSLTISGNDREALFSDYVWSVRSCEGTLKKRGNCLILNDADAAAFIAPQALSGKLSIRRTPAEQLTHQAQPRAVLRVATRGGNNSRGSTRETGRVGVTNNLEPFLQDLQNDVARLSRAFATLGREANALVRSEAEIRARMENGSRGSNSSTTNRTERALTPTVENEPTAAENQNENVRGMSRNARRRMRQRLRAALNESHPEVIVDNRAMNGQITPAQRQNGHVGSNPVHMVGLAVVPQPPVPPPPVPFPALVASNENHARSNRRRRQRR